MRSFKNALRVEQDRAFPYVVILHFHSGNKYASKTAHPLLLARKIQFPTD
jgi:hypothetical protein